jgi:hypothetical protein
MQDQVLNDPRCCICDGSKRRCASDPQHPAFARCLSCGHSSRRKASAPKTPALKPRASTDNLATLDECDRILRALARHALHGRRLVVIECGDGLLGLVALARGFDVAAVESDEVLRAKAARVFRTTVCEALPSCDQHDFDAAIVWRVLQRAYSPLSVIEQVADRVRSGGVLGLSVPHCPDKSALQRFSASSLHLALARCGFRVLDPEPNRWRSWFVPRLRRPCDLEVWAEKR